MKKVILSWLKMNLCVQGRAERQIRVEAGRICMKVWGTV